MSQCLKGFQSNLDTTIIKDSHDWFRNSLNVRDYCETFHGGITLLESCNQSRLDALNNHGYWCTKHAYIVLGCIAYIFNRGVDTSQANLLKNALVLSVLPTTGDKTLAH